MPSAPPPDPPHPPDGAGPDEAAEGRPRRRVSRAGRWLRAGDSAGGVRITLLGRAGCHLCDEAQAVVDRVAGDLGLAWEHIDIDADPRLRAAYTDLVPVVLVDGREIARWRLEEDRLRAALR